VAVENVLLSADCRDTFLCDFGLSETVDDSGWSDQAFRGGVFPGTETHMAPEVARGDPLSSKADVWSSCCMLLHMLNGCRPWTRYYSHPLCLQIVNEPPPLWEVPSHCNNFTARVFRAGLRKDPERRASARALRRRTTKALRAVGGLSRRSVRTAWEKLYQVEIEDSSPCPSSPGSSCAEPPADVSAPAVFWVSPWRTAAVDEDEDDGEAESGGSEPRSLRVEEDWDGWTDSEVDLYTGEDDSSPGKTLRTDGDWSSAEYLQALTDLFPLLQKCQPAVCGSEEELEHLREGESRKSTGRIQDSEHSSDDLSSGVFSSCNSRTDSAADRLLSANQPSLYCSSAAGVDIWIENVQGGCVRIRERRDTKVGHVAIGISDKVSGKPFTLETLDRKTVPFDEEIRESCVWLRCVPALDTCQHWTWRVRDGKLELRE
uniref:Protein kinase domain-containing protein n=1 Tax=Tetraodon nigroviridis TaxID=99883 RepID=H3D2S3_TETNG